MKIIDRLHLGNAILNNETIPNIKDVHIVSDQFIVNFMYVLRNDALGLFTERQLLDAAYEFSLWEQNNVLRVYNDGWVDFRDRFGLDWDEVFNDYLQYKVSGKKRPWSFDVEKFKEKHRHE